MPKSRFSSSYLIVVMTLSAAWSIQLVAQESQEDTSEEKKDLLDRSPFDRIYLDKFNKDVVLEVEELNFRGNLTPSANPPTETLQFQFLWDSAHSFAA